MSILIRGKRSFIKENQCMICQKKCSPDELESEAFYEQGLPATIFIFCDKPKCQENGSKSYLTELISKRMFFVKKHIIPENENFLINRSDGSKSLANVYHGLFPLRLNSSGKICYYVHISNSHEDGLSAQNKWVSLDEIFKLNSELLEEIMHDPNHAHGFDLDLEKNNFWSEFSQFKEDFKRSINNLNDQYVHTKIKSIKK